MKRHAIALLVHPFKNRLVAPQTLKTAIDACMRTVLDLAALYPNIRLNIVMPGYLFEAIDTLMLTELRDVQKRGALEWLVTGFTEPFLSFSPQWLCRENIKASLQLFTEVLGQKPSGYVPPFSNWEPDYIDVLRELGFNHVALSNFLLPADCRSYCATWATEHNGSSMIVFPVHTLHPYTAPANIDDWLENRFSQDNQNITPLKILGIHYLVPLDTPGAADPYEWLRTAVAALDKLILKYETMRFSEYLSANAPLGLQYFPPSLLFSQNRLEVSTGFWNWLFTYDQVGVMQRRLMEVTDAMTPAPGRRPNAKALRRLFDVQDINRFLPCSQSGFEQCTDRAWFYRKVTEIEQEARKEKRAKGGQIRIVDHLRNGTKCLIMSNPALAMYIDHHNGGTVFELDCTEPFMNLAAGYNPQRHGVPSIVVPGKSRTLFVDHFLHGGTTLAEFANGVFTELGDFVRGRFDYSVKKSGASVKTVLNRQGALQQADRACPLHVEKVFALEKETADLSFVYQFANRSLMTYAFTFASELTLNLPGATEGLARVLIGGSAYKDLAVARIVQPDVTELVLEDELTGFRATLQTRTPVTVWCFPVGQSSAENQKYNGTTIVLLSDVSLTESSSFSLMGKLIVRPLKTHGEAPDAV